MRVSVLSPLIFFQWRAGLEAFWLPVGCVTGLQIFPSFVTLHFAVRWRTNTLLGSHYV